MQNPAGLAVSPTGTHLAVADCCNHRVSVFRVADGAFVGHVGDGITNPECVMATDRGWLVSSQLEDRPLVHCTWQAPPSAATMGEGGEGSSEGVPWETGGGCPGAGAGAGARREDVLVTVGQRMRYPKGLAWVPGLGLFVRDSDCLQVGSVLWPLWAGSLGWACPLVLAHSPHGVSSFLDSPSISFKVHRSSFHKLLRSTGCR